MKDNNKIDNKTEKAKYRLWAKDLRKNINLKRVSGLIEAKLTKLDVYRSAKTVMSYMAKDMEISLRGLFNDNSKSWFLPVVVETLHVETLHAETFHAETLHAMSLRVVPYHPNETKLSKNKFDILEPENNDQQDKKIKLDIIFVPGLCFDKKGNRIGFGAGYYDRFLKLNPDSFKIGCCPKECLVNELPVDLWDYKVDLVVTD